MNLAIILVALLSLIALAHALLIPAPRRSRRTAVCRHYRIAPVELSDGERVAYLCLDCEDQLPPEFASPGRKEHW